MYDPESEENDSDFEEICSIPFDMAKLFIDKNSKKEIIHNNSNQDCKVCIEQKDSFSLTSFNISIEEEQHLKINPYYSELCKLKPALFSNCSQNSLLNSKPNEIVNEKRIIGNIEKIQSPSMNSTNNDAVNKIKVELFNTKIKSITNKYIALKIRDLDRKSVV